MSRGRWAADLEQAERLMHGSGPVGHQSLRMVCWLLRSVLEQTYCELVDAQGAALGSSSNRAALICLRALYEDTAPDLADDAESAWNRLSRAVHHHAYELSPTLGEVKDLMRQVTDVAEFAARQGR
ncbi:hypothetical protein [Promicromonospora sp. NPDC023987]|uniref:hypothetical protein n=1 Tax=Promicromonospora sp. NPDC023987 TaxID=3155360 RepID=UPI00341188E1